MKPVPLMTLVQSPVVWFTACALTTVWLQWLALSSKVMSLDTAESLPGFVELKTTGAWRYGYVGLHHGAVLVKVRNMGRQSLPDRPQTTEEATADTVAAGVAAHAAAADEVRSIMARELELVPLKAGLELALYLALLAWAFFGARWFKLRLVGDSDRRLLRFVASAVSWMIPWTGAVAPLLFWGYGHPLFTNWMGPGALSWSGGYLISWGTGLCVSYRTFIEAASLLPLVVLGAAARAAAPYRPPIGDAVLLWIAGLIIYGLAGGLRAEDSKPARKLDNSAG